MDLVHDRGSMDPVHESGPWTRSKVGVHGPLVHVLSSPSIWSVQCVSISTMNRKFFPVFTLSAKVVCKDF